jgi:conjugative relaxase-like TrwC/TraI family protein
VLKIQKIGAGEVAKVKYPEQEQGLQQELAMQQGIEIERERLDTGYYSEHGRAGARWLGSAWQGLGYSEDVSQDQLVGLILEHATASGDPVHRIHGRTTVFGLEVDLSAPKSFSDAYAIAEPAVQRRLMELWNEAVADTVARMEREYIRTRDGSGELRHHMLTGGVAVRAYTHFTSRDQDPQVHAHLLMPNMAQEVETGEWKAIDTDYLYRNAKALGHWFQARLRDLTERELGVEWGEVRNGTAEMVGMPDEYLKATSQRSQTIREKTAALAESGIRADLHMRDEIAMETRRDKVWIDDLGEWQDLQRVRAAEFGLGAEEIAALMPGARAIEPSGVDLDVLADELFGPSGLTAMRNTFTPGDLIIALTDAGVKEFELDTAIERLLADPRALELDGRLGPTLTTQELVDHEQEIIHAFEEGVGQAADVTVSRDAVDSVLETVSFNLEPGQRQALYAITGSENAFIAIEARAGTGKTTIANLARRALEREEIFMLGAAPTGIAAWKMRTEGIANSHTLAKLHLHIKNGKTLRELLPPRARRGVLFIDEAGMAHTREAAAVIRQARLEGLKIIAVGDSRQLKSVMAGGWLRYISENYGGPELTDVIRQSDELERTALNQLAARQPREYVQYQQRKGRIHEFKLEHQDLAIRAAADMLIEAAGRNGYHETLLMTRDNQRRQILNQYVQDLRRERGQLGDEVLMKSSEGQDLYRGDRVMLKRNFARRDVYNGTRGTVVGRDASGNLVIVADGAGHEQRTLPPEYVSAHARLGYASTFYGGQALTVKTAIVITQPNEVSANSGYTALSRNVQATHIFLIGDNNGLLTPTGQLELALRRDDVEELAIEQLREWEEGLETEPELERYLAEDAAYEQYRVRDEETLARIEQQLEDTEQESLDQTLRAAVERDAPAETQQPEPAAAEVPLSGPAAEVAPPEPAAELERPAPTPVMFQTPARDAYLTNADAIRAVEVALTEPWARQADKTRKLTDSAAQARRAAERHASIPEPPLWEREKRSEWRQARDRAQTRLQTASQQAQQGRNELASYGDPDKLVERYVTLANDRDALVAAGFDLPLAAYAEEIARQPIYLTEALGQQPADRNSLRRWTTAAHGLIRDRWNRGILNDDPVAPSRDVERGITQYLEHIRGHGLDKGEAPDLFS